MVKRRGPEQLDQTENIGGAVSKEATHADSRLLRNAQAGLE
jgi:hypothetical protein